MDNRDRTLGIVLAVVVLVVLLGPVLGWGMMGGGVMGPGMMGGWWAGNPGWGVAMLVFWVLLIAGIVLLVVWGVRQSGPGAGASHRPLGILKERYARGELTRQQYAQMRRGLE